MIKNMINFDRHDWSHIKFLFRNLLIQLFVRYNWSEAKEAFIWMKIHLKYHSEKVE